MRLRSFATSNQDELHYKVRGDGTVITKEVYNIIGVNSEEVKELIGLYLAESEGARFWLQVLKDIRRRGLM